MIDYFMAKKLTVVPFDVIDTATNTAINEYRLCVIEADTTGRERTVDIAVFYNHETTKKFIDIMNTLGQTIEDWEKIKK